MISHSSSPRGLSVPREQFSLLRSISDLPFTQPDDFTPAVSNLTVFECKYELDSLAAFLEISTNYYEATGDIEFFQKFQWVDAINTVLDTTQALLIGTYASNGSVNTLPYTWERTTTSATETLDNSGRGNPVQDGTGLVRSAFRPSDDA
jgi:meiotically up-regulated gene 157 (Mug157) protein